MKKIIDVEGIQFCSANDKITIKAKRGRGIFPVNTGKYNQYVHDVKLLSSLKMKGDKLKPPYKLIISSRSLLDPDNGIKGLFDGLQASGVIDNDKNIRVYTVIHEQGSDTKLEVWAGSYNEESSLLDELLVKREGEVKALHGLLIDYYKWASESLGRDMEIEKTIKQVEESLYGLHGRNN